MKNKKGLSGVITAVIMIALVLAASAIIWTAVNSLVKSRLESATSCFDIFDKLTINSGYTCYNSTSNELRISIERDIELSEILISLASPTESKTIKLPSKKEEKYIRLANETGYNGEIKQMPNLGLSRTYVINLTLSGFGESSLDSIKLYPVVGGNKCGASSVLSNIVDCALLS